MYLKKNILIFIFISFALYSFIGTFHSAISFNWSFQDWLINYEGGFVRRGFSGSIISSISNFFFNQNKQFYFDIQIHSIYFYIIGLFCVLFYFLLYQFLKSEKSSFKKQYGYVPTITDIIFKTSVVASASQINSNIDMSDLFLELRAFGFSKRAFHISYIFAGRMPLLAPDSPSVN